MATTASHASRRRPFVSIAQLARGLSVLRPLFAWPLALAEDALRQCALPSASTRIELDALVHRLAETRRRARAKTGREAASTSAGGRGGASAGFTARKRQAAPAIQQ